MKASNRIRRLLREGVEDAGLMELAPQQAQIAILTVEDVVEISLMVVAAALGNLEGVVITESQKEKGLKKLPLNRKIGSNRRLS
jgi:hypothetical protein